MQLLPKPLFLFAPGAGAPSSHRWRVHWTELIKTIGNVCPFDYSYAAEGRKRPDPLPQLIESHRMALEKARQLHEGPVILIGKSMGGRVGCHLALKESVAAVVCLSYPLCAAGDCGKLRSAPWTSWRECVGKCTHSTNSRLWKAATIRCWS